MRRLRDMLALVGRGAEAALGFGMQGRSFRYAAFATPASRRSLASRGRSTMRRALRTTIGTSGSSSSLSERTEVASDSAMRIRSRRGRRVGVAPKRLDRRSLDGLLVRVQRVGPKPSHRSHRRTSYSRIYISELVTERPRALPVDDCHPASAKLIAEAFHRDLADAGHQSPIRCVLHADCTVSNMLVDGGPPRTRGSVRSAR
jgi:hypothetical protein